MGVFFRALLSCAQVTSRLKLFGVFGVSSKEKEGRGKGGGLKRSFGVSKIQMEKVRNVPAVVKLVTHKTGRSFPG